MVCAPFIFFFLTLKSKRIRQCFLWGGGGVLVTLMRVYCQTYTNLAASEEYGFVSSDIHSSL